MVSSIARRYEVTQLESGGMSYLSATVRMSRANRIRWYKSRPLFFAIAVSSYSNVYTIFRVNSKASGSSLKICFSFEVASFNT
jgi:hypothetical protein